MAPISLDQLYTIIEKQDRRIAALQSELATLKSWSDLQDHYLQEMIESTSNTVDRLLTAVNELHDADIAERVKELEEEEQMPVAQLLLDFIEENASEEQKEEMRHPH